MNEMNLPEEIMNLPQTKREREHRGRKRIGYHVYLSYYFYLFGELENEEKRAIMRRYNVWDDVDDDDDDGSIDTTMTPRHPMHYEISRTAAMNWKDMENEGKNAWKDRASDLNRRPQSDGRFMILPSDLAVESSLRTNVLLSLSQDWMHLVHQFKQSILLKSRPTRIPQSKKTYRFGNEIVVMCSQIYRIFYLNHLLKITIFGIPLFSKLLAHELPYATKKQTIIHLLSHRRISDLLTFGGLDAATHYKNGLKYLCCAKVNLKRRGMNSIGYVLDEECDMLTIKSETAEVIRMKRPEFDKVRGSYRYEHGGDDSGNQSQSFSLTELWPIRIKINISGQASFIISVATYNE